MKKGLIASLIAYAVLLIAVATLMLTYVILHRTVPAGELKGLFTAVTVTFIVFVVVFAAVIALLIIYPKHLEKEYRVHVEEFIEEHNTKHPDKAGRVITNLKDKTVLVSFFMGEDDIDTYSFELKEKPLTKNEPKRIVSNILADIDQKALEAKAKEDKASE